MTEAWNLRSGATKRPIRRACLRRRGSRASVLGAPTVHPEVSWLAARLGVIRVIGVLSAIRIALTDQARVLRIFDHESLATQGILVQLPISCPLRA